MTNRTQLLNDSELERVTGGTAALTPVETPAQQAAAQLSAIYLNNHPIHLGSFPPPHVDVPHIG
jgi:hypothetical protein